MYLKFKNESREKWFFSWNSNYRTKIQLTKVSIPYFKKYELKNKQ